MVAGPTPVVVALFVAVVVTSRVISQVAAGQLDVEIVPFSVEVAVQTIGMCPDPFFVAVVEVDTMVVVVRVVMDLVVASFGYETRTVGEGGVGTVVVFAALVADAVCVVSVYIRHCLQKVYL